jgi:type II secretion system protein G
MNLLLAAVLLMQDKNFDQLIEQLGSEKIEVRNEAARKLKELGDKAIPALERTANAGDGEASRHAKEILLDLRDPLRGETAEQSYTRSVEAIEKASTIQVIIRIECTNGDEKSKLEEQPALILLIKGEDKVAGKPEDPSIKSRGIGIPNRDAYPPKDLRDDSVTGLSKLTLFVSLYSGGVERFGAKKPVHRRVADTLQISNIVVAGQDALGRILTYDIKMDKESLTGKVWIDLKTRLPRKRIVSTGTQHFIESYEGWILNADIPDEKFMVPGQDISPEAKIAKAKGDLMSFQTALGAYELDNGGFPKPADGLAALFTKPQGANRWKGPYMQWKTLPLDPWGNPYVYRFPGVKHPEYYDLASFGPDGKPGTADDIER